MDRLDQMRLFVRVVDRQSFSAAATDLGLARSTATEAIKRLEATLGTRLLERTTRHVSPTLDGRTYVNRCKSILAEVEAADAAFRDSQPRGLLRIDAHGLLTRTFVLPRLPEFLDRYPGIDLHLGQGDRLVDMVREGIDCVLRAGPPEDSSLIQRRLALIPEITCASPAYLERHGTPRHPDDLEGHRMVGFVSSRTGEVLPLEFMGEGGLREALLPCRVTANNSTTLADLARQGYGLIQAPRYRFLDDLREGRMVEVLADFPPTPTPLHAIIPQNRHMAPRLRVFLDWVAEVFREAEF
jgi:DNA-binding transcriptional LysR family regulator